METYDYTEGGAGCDISSQIDAMSARELQAAAEAIRAIRQTSAHARLDSSRAWFDAAILPALRDFAEMTAPSSTPSSATPRGWTSRAAASA